MGGCATACSFVPISSFLAFAFSSFFLFLNLMVQSSFLFAQSFIFEHCVAPYFAIFLGIPLLMFCVRHHFAGGLVIDFLHETNPIRQYPLPGFTDDVLTLGRGVKAD